MLLMPKCKENWRANCHIMGARKDEFIGKNQKNIPLVGKIEGRTIANHQHINKDNISTKLSPVSYVLEDVT
jgi:hypothetical protein